MLFQLDLETQFEVDAFRQKLSQIVPATEVTFFPVVDGVHVQFVL